MEWCKSGIMSRLQEWNQHKSWDLESICGMLPGMNIIKRGHYWNLTFLRKEHLWTQWTMELAPSLTSWCRTGRAGQAWGPTWFEWSTWLPVSALAWWLAKIPFPFPRYTKMCHLCPDGAQSWPLQGSYGENYCKNHGIRGRFLSTADWANCAMQLICITRVLGLSSEKISAQSVW